MKAFVKEKKHAEVPPHLNRVGATSVAIKAPLHGTLPINPGFSEALGGVR